MSECSKNIFNKIPITLLELEIICQSRGKFMRKTSRFTTFSYNGYKTCETKLFSELFDTIMCKIVRILKN
jgi:hypothetical protein